MTEYRGYAGYGTDEAKAKRLRGMADLLTQQSMTDRFAPVQHWTQGLGRIAEALAANNLSQQADAAESAYADNRKKATDLLISQIYPDTQSVITQGLAAPEAFDLTPAGAEQRQTQGSMGDKVRSLANLLGDPVAAIQWGRDEQANAAMLAMERERLAMEREKANQPTPYNLGDGAFAEYRPGQGITMLREPTAKPQQPAYDTVTLADGVYSVNKADPNDRIRIGAAPPRASDSPALTPYQQAQLERQAREDDIKAEERNRANQSKLMQLDDTIRILDEFVLGTGNSLPDGGTYDQRSDRFNEVYGNLIPWAIPGTERANGIAILDQLGGRSFLDSIQSMRGFGQLSNAEGLKVQAAASRLMDQNQSDKAAMQAAQEFRESLVRFRNAVRQDIEREQQRMGIAAPEKPPQDGSQGNLVDSLVQGAQNLFGGVADMFSGSGKYRPGMIDVDEDTGEKYRFKGGNPQDPNSWELVR